jgi:hypothetical protein
LDHPLIARLLLSLLCLIQGIATLSIDLNRTHATNPLWPRHARFHLVWQTFSTVLFCAAEIAIVWWKGPFEQQRFYLAALLASLPLLAFLIALASRAIYGGALSDPNGIPPVRLTILRRTLHIDVNLAAVLVGLLVVMVAVFIE